MSANEPINMTQFSAESAAGAASRSVISLPTLPRIESQATTERFFLRRLRRLLILRRYCDNAFGPNDPEMRLLRQSIYSTYRDCLGLGLIDEAQGLLRSAGA